MTTEKSQNVQDVFLNHVRKNKTPVTVFLVNGVKLQGIITWFDNFCVLLRRDALADQPAVDLELALARPAEKAEPAALAFEMRPRPHQPRALVRQCRQFDLQATLMGAGARAEDLENEPGSVDHLGLPAPLEVALLHRAQRRIDDDEADRALGDDGAQILDVAAAE